MLFKKYQKLSPSLYRYLYMWDKLLFWSVTTNLCTPLSSTVDILLNIQMLEEVNHSSFCCARHSFSDKG